MRYLSKGTVYYHSPDMRGRSYREKVTDCGKFGKGTDSRDFQLPYVYHCQRRTRLNYAFLVSSPLPSLYFSSTVLFLKTKATLGNIAHDDILQSNFNIGA